ncbi:SRPBCC domain-containing protein [Amycolatopsis dongchuanensis]|uniref:SRPBCC domain-containing protein n=1 Tax=Amycolatopsis dongchuanensis TaxID=1070866 RepID=A0ABP8VIG2_9PSEU
MRILDTAITIGAPPEAIWAVLTDFARYEEWNPFIRRGEGEAVNGSTLTLDIEPPGELRRTHRPVVLAAEPGRRLVWLGRIPVLLAGRHEFVLEPDGAGTRLRQREEMRGLLVPFLRRVLDHTEDGFVAMNHALKRRVEG